MIINLQLIGTTLVYFNIYIAYNKVWFWRNQEGGYPVNKNIFLV